MLSSCKACQAFLSVSLRSSGRLYRHPGSCHMELQEKQGSIGDWEKEEEHVCKKLLARAKQVWEAGGLALFFFFSFCNENLIAHLQQDNASVESKIVINTLMCSSAQNTVYTFQAKPTYLSYVTCIKFFSILPNTLFYSLYSLFTAFLFLQTSLFHCPVFYIIFFQLPTLFHLPSYLTFSPHRVLSLLVKYMTASFTIYPFHHLY